MEERRQRLREEERLQLQEQLRRQEAERLRCEQERAREREARQAAAAQRRTEARAAAALQRRRRAVDRTEEEEGAQAEAEEGEADEAEEEEAEGEAEAAAGEAEDAEEELQEPQAAAAAAGEAQRPEPPVEEAVSEEASMEAAAAEAERRSAEEAAARQRQRAAAEERAERKAEEEASRRAARATAEEKARLETARQRAGEAAAAAARRASEEAALLLCRASRPEGGQQDAAGPPGDDAVDQWKLRRLIHALTLVRSSGYNSMLSMIIGCKDSLVQANKVLTESLSACDTLQLHAHKVQAQAIIISVMQRLKLYRQTPRNGLAIFCGFLAAGGGKERKVLVDFEPCRPINTSLYRNGKTFFTEELQDLLTEGEQRFGFIVIDGSGALFGSLQGSRKEVLSRFSVDLPKKHSKGGQSAQRFARLRREKRQLFVRKAAELATQLFLAGDRPTVSALFLAGCADFKAELARSEALDARLEALVVRPLLDLSYGGDSGFHQAIELAAGQLRDVRLVQEKRVVTRLMEEIAKDTGKYCIGVRDTLQALAMGAVETLILWEGFELTRLLLRHPQTEAEQVEHVRPGDVADERLLTCPETGVKLDLVESVPFVEWAVENYRSLSAKLEFVTDRSQEGHQFCRGFGGLGGLLRYRVDFEAFDEPSDAEAQGAEAEEAEATQDSDEDFA